MVETSQYERQQQFSSAIIFLSGMYFPNCSPSFLRSLRRFIDIKFPKPNVYMNTELMRPEANCKLSTYYRSLYYIVQLDIWCWWPIISPRAINDKRQRLIYIAMRLYDTRSSRSLECVSRLPEAPPNVLKQNSSFLKKLPYYEGKRTLQTLLFAS